MTLYHPKQPPRSHDCVKPDEWLHPPESLFFCDECDRAFRLSAAGPHPAWRFITPAAARHLALSMEKIGRREDGIQPKQDKSWGAST